MAKKNSPVSVKAPFVPFDEQKAKRLYAQCLEQFHMEFAQPYLLQITKHLNTLTLLGAKGIEFKDGTWKYKFAKDDIVILHDPTSYGCSSDVFFNDTSVPLHGYIQRFVNLDWPKSHIFALIEIWRICQMLTSLGIAPKGLIKKHPVVS